MRIIIALALAAGAGLTALAAEGPIYQACLTGGDNTDAACACAADLYDAGLSADENAFMTAMAAARVDGAGPEEAQISAMSVAPLDDTALAFLAAKAIDLYDRSVSECDITPRTADDED